MPVSLRKVILFGSYIAGKQTLNSDIDVALEADEFSGVPSEDVKLFLNALRNYYIIQPQTFNQKQFAVEADPFIEAIVKTLLKLNFNLLFIRYI